MVTLNTFGISADGGLIKAIITVVWIIHAQIFRLLSEADVDMSLTKLLIVLLDSEDFAPLTNLSVNFEPSPSTNVCVNVSVNIVNDSIVEVEETLQAELTSSDPSISDLPMTAAISITNDDCKLHCRFLSTNSMFACIVQRFC